MSPPAPGPACAGKGPTLEQRAAIVHDLGRQPYEPVWRAMQAFLAVLDGVTLEDLMVTSSGASGAGSAARTVLPTVALPRNSALARRRKPGAADPELE